MLMVGAEPYYHAGGRIGCLILHGFTASPAEVRWLGESLAVRGHTVYAPRLPGHGTHPNDLARVQWRDWVTAGLDGVHLLRATCQKVIVIGHSMGGLVALHLAAQTEIDGLALMASPIDFQGAARYARWIRFVMPYSDQTDRSPFVAYLREEQARRGQPVVGRVRYDRWASAGVAQLVAMSDAARGVLGQITAPLCLIYSEKDPTVPYHHMDIIADEIASTSIERHTLNRGGHILPQDIAHDEVFRIIGDFVARYDSDSSG